MRGAASGDREAVSSGAAARSEAGRPELRNHTTPATSAAHTRAMARIERFTMRFYATDSSANYLTEPLATSTNFRKQPDSTG